MSMKSHHISSRSRGFSMMETMISLAIVASAITFAMQLAQTGEDQAAGRTNADALSSFSQLAGQFFISNRIAMEKAMDDGTDADEYCKIGVASDGTGGTVARSSTKKTCAFDATLLLAKGVWPAGISTDAFGGRYVAIFRKIYDASSQPTGAVEALMVLASPDGTLQPAAQDARKLEELAASQTTLGGTGGLIPVGALGDCVASRTSATYQVCGNGWKVNLSDFIDNAELTTFANSLPN